VPALPRLAQRQRKSDQSCVETEAFSGKLSARRRLGSPPLPDLTHPFSRQLPVRLASPSQRELLQFDCVAPARSGAGVHAEKCPASERIHRAVTGPRRPFFRFHRACVTLWRICFEGLASRAALPTGNLCKILPWRKKQRRPLTRA